MTNILRAHVHKMSILINFICSCEIYDFLKLQARVFKFGGLILGYKVMDKCKISAQLITTINYNY